jgi:hypothetical protein
LKFYLAAGIILLTFGGCNHHRVAPANQYNQNSKLNAMALEKSQKESLKNKELEELRSQVISEDGMFEYYSKDCSTSGWAFVEQGKYEDFKTAIACGKIVEKRRVEAEKTRLQNEQEINNLLKKVFYIGDKIPIFSDLGFVEMKVSKEVVTIKALRRHVKYLEAFKYLLSALASKEVEQVKKGIISIGMSKNAARLSWGEPEKINATTTKYGLHEQWIYKGHQYVYFENDVLTSIQQSR